MVQRFIFSFLLRQQNTYIFWSTVISTNYHDQHVERRWWVSVWFCNILTLIFRFLFFNFIAPKFENPALTVLAFHCIKPVANRCFQFAQYFEFIKKTKKKLWIIFRPVENCNLCAFLDFSHIYRKNLLVWVKHIFVIEPFAYLRVIKICCLLNCCSFLNFQLIFNFNLFHFLHIHFLLQPYTALASCSVSVFLFSCFYL